MEWITSAIKWRLLKIDLVNQSSYLVNLWGLWSDLELFFKFSLAIFGSLGC